MPINGAPYTFRGGNITASQITDSTAAGRALLTGADASAQRTSLELTALATQAPGSTENVDTSATPIMGFTNGVFTGNV